MTLYLFEKNYLHIPNLYLTLFNHIKMVNYVNTTYFACQKLKNCSINRNERFALLLYIKYVRMKFKY